MKRENKGRIYPGLYRVNLLHDEELLDIFKGKVQQGIYVVNQRTETPWFQLAISKAHAVVFFNDTPMVALVFGAGFRDHTLSKKLSCKVIVLNEN